jgi:hypothetical protein
MWINSGCVSALQLPGQSNVNQASGAVEAIGKMAPRSEQKKVSLLGEERNLFSSSHSN